MKYHERGRLPASRIQAPTGPTVWWRTALAHETSLCKLTWATSRQLLCLEMPVKVHLLFAFPFLVPTVNIEVNFPFTHFYRDSRATTTYRRPYACVVDNVVDNTFSSAYVRPCALRPQLAYFRAHESSFLRLPSPYDSPHRPTSSYSNRYFHVATRGPGHDFPQSVSAHIVRALPQARMTDANGGRKGQYAGGLCTSLVLVCPECAIVIRTLHCTHHSY